MDTKENTSKKPLAKGVKGAHRLKIIQAHRLLMYYVAFDMYRAGRCSLEYLLERIDKVIESGIKIKVR